MLALDLGVLNRRSHRFGFREALAWSGVWIALAAGFAVLVLFWHGRAPALPLDHLRIRRFARLFGNQAAAAGRDGNPSREEPGSSSVPPRSPGDKGICGGAVLYAEERP